MKYEIDLVKGVKIQQIEAAKKDLVKAEKLKKEEHLKMRVIEKEAALKERQASVARVRESQRVG